MSDMENEDYEDENLALLADLAGDVSNVGHPWAENENSFLQLQEANNICRAAYLEIMTIALEAKTWVEATPALGSLEDFLKLFQSEPLPGMRVERSIESAVLPVAADTLVSMMVDVEKWASSFCHIVHCASSSIPMGVLGKLNKEDHGVLNIQMVNAEFHLPTPFVQNRKSCFLRWQKEIIPDVWAILDLSYDYFPYWPSDCTLEPNCWKKPSGMIIRKREDNSEVIWIENMEVYEELEDNIYSAVMNSDSTFSVRRLVRTLLWKLKRDESRIFNVKMQVNEQADTYLLGLTESMKMAYLEFVNAAPDKRKWVTLYDQGIRILRTKAVYHGDIWASNNYIALTSFRVQAEPHSVFDFLVEKNLEIQWGNSLSSDEHEELIKLANYEERNCITLHKKVTEYIDSTQLSEYLLQEASRDEFCSFIISAPMTQLEFADALLLGRWSDISLQPSGFSIMSAGSLQSDASLVTIAMQQQLDTTEMEQVIESMSDLINTIIEEITEKFALDTTNPGSRVPN